MAPPLLISTSLPRGAVDFDVVAESLPLMAMVALKFTQSWARNLLNSDSSFYKEINSICLCCCSVGKRVQYSTGMVKQVEHQYKTMIMFRTSGITQRRQDVRQNQLDTPQLELCTRPTREHLPFNAFQTKLISVAIIFVHISSSDNSISSSPFLLLINDSESP